MSKAAMCMNYLMLEAIPPTWIFWIRRSKLPHCERYVTESFLIAKLAQRSTSGPVKVVSLEIILLVSIVNEPACKTRRFYPCKPSQSGDLLPDFGNPEVKSPIPEISHSHHVASWRGRDGSISWCQHEEFVLKSFKLWAISRLLFPRKTKASACGACVVEVETSIFEPLSLQTAGQRCRVSFFVLIYWSPDTSDIKVLRQDTMQGTWSNYLHLWVIVVADFEREKPLL